MRARGVQRHHQVGRHRGDEASRATIDMELVDAYLARRALDYLVGFTLSPVLWRKLPGARSAGRVQSVALRLIVDREIEIEAFRTQEYWTRRGRRRRRRRSLPGAAGQAPGQAPWPSSTSPTRPRRTAAKAAVQAGRLQHRRASRRSPARRTPAAALHHLDPAAGGLAQARLLRPAHHAGRPEALRGRRHRRRDRRPDHLHADRRRAVRARGAGRGARGDRRPLWRRLRPRRSRAIYKTKAKNAQEAHEAIRPTSLARNPGSLRLEPDLGRLYELIWKRMVASQMEAARIERTTIDLESADGQTGLRATGQVVLFDGYLAVYEEGRDDAATTRNRGRLPQVQRGRRRQGPRRPRRPALHRAAAALLRGQPGEEDGGARHRPALDLRLDPLACCATATMCGWTRTASCPRTRAGWSPPSWSSSSAAMSSTTSPPRWRRSSTWSRPASWTGRRCCASSGATSTPPSARSASLRTTQVLDALNEALGPAHLPRQGRWPRPARLPHLRRTGGCR